MRGSKLYSILNFKCPKCHVGDLYDTPTFSFRKPFDMPQACSHCGQSYWPEPGFYYGAMFVSYIFTGWFCLGFVALVHWVFGVGLFESFGLLIVVLALLFVYFFRLSRAIWINLNVHFDPRRAESK
jgi:uncharacterized protein (DUF983 family)